MTYRMTRRRLIGSAISATAALPLLATHARAASHAVTIRQMAFTPKDLTVAVGDTVIFTNEDSAPHTATADNGSFDTDRLRRGASAEVTFSEPGTYAYHCALHPMMRGTITVA